MAIFTNQATLSYNNTTTTSNVVTGEIVEVLSATKRFGKKRSLAGG